MRQEKAEKLAKEENKIGKNESNGQKVIKKEMEVPEKPKPEKTKAMEIQKSIVKREAVNEIKRNLHAEYSRFIRNMVEVKIVKSENFTAFGFKLTQNQS